MPRFRCPYCDRTLEHVEVRQDVTEWGSHYLPDVEDSSDFWDGNTEISDSETQDSTCTCPYCEREVGTDELFEDDEEEDGEDGDEKESPEEEDNTEVVVPHLKLGDKLLFTTSYGSMPIGMPRYIKCKKCRHVIPTSDEDEFVTCINCSEENKT